MPPSPGRSVSSHLVSRLRKALYGLKQANSGSKARFDSGLVAWKESIDRRCCRKASTTTFLPNFVPALKSTFRLKKDWRITSQKGRDREAPSIQRAG